jgi:hypothetical protein
LQLPALQRPALFNISTAGCVHSQLVSKC